MSVSDADIAFAKDLFAGLGPLTSRKMMGGLCLYADGTIFAILNSDGSIYLKGAGQMKDRMEAEDWTRWTYARAGKPETKMPYWQLPDDVLDDPDQATILARTALACL